MKYKILVLMIYMLRVNVSSGFKVQNDLFGWNIRLKLNGE